MPEFLSPILLQVGFKPSDLAVFYMRTPLKLKGASEEERVQYAFERFMSSKNLRKR
jgi:hypothetical protein